MTKQLTKQDGGSELVTLSGPDGAPIALPPAIWPEGFGLLEEWIALVDELVDFTTRAQKEIWDKPFSDGVYPVTEDEMKKVPAKVKRVDAGFERYEAPQYWERCRGEMVVSAAFVADQVDILLGAFERCYFHDLNRFIEITTAMIVHLKPVPQAVESAVRRYWREHRKAPTGPAVFLDVLKLEMERWEDRISASYDALPYVKLIREKRGQPAPRKRKSREREREEMEGAPA